MQEPKPPVYRKRTLVCLGLHVALVVGVGIASFILFKGNEQTEELHQQVSELGKQVDEAVVAILNRQDLIQTELSAQKASVPSVVTRVEYRTVDANNEKIDQVERNQEYLRNQIEALSNYIEEGTAGVKVEVNRAQNELSLEIVNNFGRLTDYLGELELGDSVSGTDRRQRPELFDTANQNKLRSAHIAFNERRYSEAAGLFGEVFEADPSIRDAELYGAISLYYSRPKSDGQRRETKQTLQIILLEDPRNSKALEVLAEIATEEGMWEEAVSLYKRWLISNEGTAEIFARAGYACLFNDMPSDGLMYFEQAVAKDPQRWEYYLGAGRSYLALGQRDQAEEQYRRALDLDPENRDIRRFGEELQ
jgi:tetratricopeptide (TPR) repeat protein